MKRVDYFELFRSEIFALCYISYVILLLLHAQMCLPHHSSRLSLVFQFKDIPKGLAKWQNSRLSIFFVVNVCDSYDDVRCDVKL